MKEGHELVPLEGMHVGRELDVLIAEKVMGDKSGRFPTPLMAWIPRYSTDMMAAWEIVKALTPKWSFFMALHPDVSRLAFTDESGEVEYSEECDKDSVPLAICLAALKAVGATT